MNAEERYRLQKQAERKKNDGRMKVVYAVRGNFSLSWMPIFQNFLGGAWPQTPLLFLTHFSNYNLTGLIIIN